MHLPKRENKMFAMKWKSFDGSIVTYTPNIAWPIKTRAKRVLLKIPELDKTPFAINSCR